MSFSISIKDLKSIQRPTCKPQRELPAAVKTQMEEISHQIEAYVLSQETNLIRREEWLQNIQIDLNALTAQFRESDLEPELLQELQQRLTPQLGDMEDKKSDLYYQKKWWRSLKFPEAALSSSPDCVQFVMRSAIGYSMAMFQNSTASGPERHAIRLGENQEVWLKMEGHFLPWSMIKQLVEYDPIVEQIVSRLNRNETYNYISPEGLVKRSRYPKELYAVEQLDLTERDRLQAHAARFWQNHPEVDQGQPKNCTIQIVSTLKDHLSNDWFTQQLKNIIPQHTSIRLVDGEGRLYSFGTDYSPEFKQYAKNNPLGLLATGYAQVVTPDFQETRPFEEQTVTSIPITQERLNQILKLVNQVNEEGGMRFCMTRQNCNKFCVMQLMLAGIELDTQTSFGEILMQAIPTFGPFSWLKNQVEKVVGPIFAIINKYTPTVIVRVITFIPRKACALAFNLIALCFASTTEVQKQPPDKPTNEAMDNRRFICFTSHITWWGDLFDDEKTLCNHSYKLLEWQKKQATTQIYKPNNSPKMHIFPTSQNSETSIV